jgi:gamma-glutamylcyclotransferase (GGCT)/AIG2-like uncharacterized protein YtfP
MYYFAYASNLNQEQMKERCPDSKPLFTVTLPNYKLVFVGWSRQWRGAKATIRPFRGEKVLGAIYEITEHCLRRLDREEGYPADYDHLNVTVFNEDGESVQALAYIAKGRTEEGKPSPQYLAVVQQGYREWRIV